MADTFRAFVEEKLELHSCADRVETGNGILAYHRPDIAPFAYAVCLNDPLSTDSIDEIIRISAGALPETVHEIYGAFNGLNLGVTQLCVYGIQVALNRADLFAIQNVPFPIDSLQLWVRPKFAPRDGLIFSRTRFPNVEQQIYHIITATGSIISGRYDTSFENVWQFDSAREWFSDQVKRIDPLARP